MNNSIYISSKGLRNSTKPKISNTVSSLSSAKTSLLNIPMPDNFSYSSKLNKEIPERIQQLAKDVSKINEYIEKKAGEFEKSENMANQAAKNIASILSNMGSGLGGAMFGTYKQNATGSNINVFNFLKSAFVVTAYAETTSYGIDIKADRVLANLENMYIIPNGLSALQGISYDEENDAYVVTINRETKDDKPDGGVMLWLDAEKLKDLNNLKDKNDLEKLPIIKEVSLEHLEELNKDKDGNYDGRAIERLGHIEGITYNTDKDCIILKNYKKEENSLFEIKLDSESGEVDVARVGNKRYYRQLSYIPSEINEKGEREPGHLVGINQEDDKYDKEPTFSYLKWEESKKSYVEDIEYAKKISKNSNQKDEVITLDIRKSKERSGFFNVQGMNYNGGYLYLSESWPNDETNSENFKLWKYKLNGELVSEYNITKDDENDKNGLQYREIENIAFDPNGNVIFLMPFEAVAVTDIKGEKVNGDTVRAKTSSKTKSKKKTTK